MTVINTNIKSLVSQNAIAKNNRDLTNAMQQLSTGKRINSASDDAAGLAISSRMTSQIKGLDQAIRNGNDAVSMLQTTEGAMIEMTNMLQRMRELAIQSSNDTYSQTDREYLDIEFQQLISEINRVTTDTQWNGMNVLDGTAGTNTDGRLEFQIGANEGQTIDHTIADLSSDGELDMISGTDILDRDNAANAITQVDDALDVINTERAGIGAVVNRITYAVDNLANVSLNTSASRSRIMDADYAKASSELARSQIVEQAATAMLAQANQQPQTVMQLLKG
jgi:flagellin